MFNRIGGMSVELLREFSDELFSHVFFFEVVVELVVKDTGAATTINGINVEEVSIPIVCW